MACRSMARVLVRSAGLAWGSGHVAARRAVPFALAGLKMSPVMTQTAFAGAAQRKFASSSHEEVDLVGSPTTREENKASLQEFLKGEMANEKESRFDPADENNGPPLNFKLVPTAKFLAGNDDILIMLEKTFGNEHVCVVTSTEVMENLSNEIDDDMMDDEDEDGGENGYGDDGGLSVVMLVAISKPTKPQPLFFECFFDRDGVQITRSHVGLGYSGFMSQQGAAATLYHTYMQYRAERQGKRPDDFSTEIDTEDKSATSPPFQELDEKLQEHFEKMLDDRGVTPELAEYLMDVLFAKESNQYLSFLQKLDQWLAD